MMKLNVRKLRDVCMAAPGLFDAILSVGELDVSKMEIALLSSDFDAISQRFFGAAAPGNLVHAIAKPIAKAIDAVAGTKLEDCGGCGMRRLKLNTL